MSERGKLSLKVVKSKEEEKAVDKDIAPESAPDSSLGREVKSSEKATSVEAATQTAADPERKDIESVKTVVAFLERFLDRKGDILAQDKKVFDHLDRDLTEESKLRLVPLFLENGKDLKYCLKLSNFLLEGSIESSARMDLLNFIERVLSDYSFSSDIESNSVLQTWLHGGSDRIDKLGFFEGQFRALSWVDEKGKAKKFSDAQIATLLCISAVWLYFKKESDFFTLTRYLSTSAFSTEVKSNNFVESQAFGFVTSMISSTKKKDFAYFLQMVSETERSLSQQLKAESIESYAKTTKILSMESLKNNLVDQVSSLENEMSRLSKEIGRLQQDVSSHQEKAKHRNTHHEDSKDELRIKLQNVLEGELREVLEKARKAHLKGKHDVVEYQIDDALEILARELKRISDNG